MKKNELLNGIVSIYKISEAFNCIEEQVIDREASEEALKKLLYMTIHSNKSLQKAKEFLNANSEQSGQFGVCRTQIINKTARDIIEEYILDLIVDNEIVLPIELDYSKPIRVTIEVDDNSIESACRIGQNILLTMLQKNPKLNFRCADFEKGGNCFPGLHGLVEQLSLKSGGEIYTKLSQLGDLVSTLDKAASNAMTRMKGSDLSVHEYNSNAEEAIPEYVNLLYLKKQEYGNNEIENIALHAENGIKNGMSFIIIGNHDIAKTFREKAGLYIKISNNNIYLSGQEALKITLAKGISDTAEKTESIIESIRNSEKIDTNVKNNMWLLDTCQGMNSNEVLRIPFAFDKNNKLRYFEIGGEAPSHALLSGSTGSGKSVALHTLIMQIIYNYHPDDVEIWAVDYKGVEFDSYMNYQIPHFRVIAHDTSIEFSLSLLDALDEEYNLRKKKFIEVGAKNISEYREKMGENSMPRIIVFIDEFQILTQAVQVYSGNKDYRTILENLLRLTRAMGISFVLCSQTIASGLSGLTDSARDQIGCRLSLKHDDDNEIRETLVIWGNENSSVISQAKNLRRGEAIYKRVRMANETAVDGKPYEFVNVNILYIEEELKKQMIEEAIFAIDSNYTKKEKIYVRGEGRIALRDKERHPVMKFIDGKYECDGDGVEWYPAAPTTLKDSFEISIENNSGANMLVVGENSELRNSIVMHSLLGFLIDPKNKIYVNFIDEEYSDRRRLLDYIKTVKSPRLFINEGIEANIEVLKSLRKLHRNVNENEIYIWYGIDKLKNELFLFNQENEEQEEDSVNQSDSNAVEDFLNYLNKLDETTDNKTKKTFSDDDIPDFEECKDILKQAFEMGSENNQFHMVIFNNNKVLKKSNVIRLENFENRIGTRMSVDDSFELFGSSLAVEKTDENTAIYYSGSGPVVPLRPYLLPDSNWIDVYNAAILRNQE